MNNKLSSLRAKLNQRQKQIEQLLNDFKGRPPLLPGSLYSLKRRCGKENCRCAQGQLHATTVLSYRGGQNPQTVTPPAEQIESLRKMTDEYRRFRTARAQLVRLQRQMLELVDQLQGQRVQQGEREFRRMRAASSRSRSRR
ncbi:MAG: hypothetical protein H8E44_00795 [Planctomycetes bacterium]|nr:hypothetical protein [Planctomycetota bacterium]